VTESVTWLRTDRILRNSASASIRVVLRARLRKTACGPSREFSQNGKLGPSLILDTHQSAPICYQDPRRDARPLNAPAAKFACENTEFFGQRKCAFEAPISVTDATDVPSAFPIISPLPRNEQLIFLILRISHYIRERALDRRRSELTFMDLSNFDLERSKHSLGVWRLPTFAFTIRDCLWPMVVVALAAAWGIDHWQARKQATVDSAALTEAKADADAAHRQEMLLNDKLRDERQVREALLDQSEADNQQITKLREQISSLQADLQASRRARDTAVMSRER